MGQPDIASLRLGSLLGQLVPKQFYVVVWLCSVCCQASFDLRVNKRVLLLFMHPFSCLKGVNAI